MKWVKKREAKGSTDQGKKGKRKRTVGERKEDVRCRGRSEGEMREGRQKKEEEEKCEMERMKKREGYD